MRDDRFPPVAKATMTRVARLCDDLPEASLVEHGIGHAVRVRKRIVAQLFAVRDPDGAVKTMLVVRADPDERRVLLDVGHPFFRVGSSGNRVGVVLGPHTDWTEIRELLTESYLVVAPKKLAAQVELPDIG